VGVECRSEYFGSGERAAFVETMSLLEVEGGLGLEGAGLRRENENENGPLPFCSPLAHDGAVPSEREEREEREERDSVERESTASEAGSVHRRSGAGRLLAAERPVMSMPSSPLNQLEHFRRCASTHEEVPSKKTPVQFRREVGEDRLREEWNSERLPTPPSLGEEVDVGSSRLWKKRQSAAGGQAFARHSPMNLPHSNSSSKAASRSPSRSTSKSNCDLSSKTASRSPSRDHRFATKVASTDLHPPPALSKPSFRRSSSSGGFGAGLGSGPGSEASAGSGLGPVDAQQPAAAPSSPRPQDLALGAQQQEKLLREPGGSNSAS